MRIIRLRSNIQNWDSSEIRTLTTKNWDIDAHIRWLTDANRAIPKAWIVQFLAPPSIRNFFGRVIFSGTTIDFK